jgi:hypothetical protein
LRQRIDKSLSVDTERHRPPQIWITEGGRVAVDQKVAIDVSRIDLADRLRHLICHILHTRDGKLVRESHVEFPRYKRQCCGRGVADDRIFDTIEVGPIRFPVLSVPYHADDLVRPELDEFERPRPNRVSAHFVRRDMTGVDRREATGEQHREGWLRPL